MYTFLPVYLDWYNPFQKSEDRVFQKMNKLVVEVDSGAKCIESVSMLQYASFSISVPDYFLVDIIIKKTDSYS